MKTGIHPKYVLATVSCACGHTWQTMSTREVLKTDLCSNCHPFYTGEQRIVDTAGQVERFMRRMSNRSQQAPQAPLAAKRGSKNKANVAPPPELRQRTPRPEANTEAEGEGEMAEAATGTEATEL
ncbi:MAG TPA: 50S ribosomal protein L31 [Chloroflexia bacterium]|nr:50S ribosomal protein L31 [Chloroflexia bacterium]